MPEITLPDKSKRKFENPLSIEDIASDIGPGLAKATVAGKIDGALGRYGQAKRTVEMRLRRRRAVGRETRFAVAD